MHCTMCEQLGHKTDVDPKARVIKTETRRDITHRIYRCPDKNCQHTFHTIEITRERFRQLETIEAACKRFAATVQE